MDVALPLLWPVGDPVTETLDLDVALVARAQRQERGAFDQLVRRHQRGVWRVVRRYLRNDADASDVTQAAFVRAFKSLDRFRGEASVRTWLYRIGIAGLCARRSTTRSPPTTTASSTA